MVRPCGRWSRGGGCDGGRNRRRWWWGEEVKGENNQGRGCVDLGDHDTPESTFLKHCYLEAVSVHDQ